MRESNQKIINDEELFHQLFPAYQTIISRLVEENILLDGGDFESLVNFQSNLSSPKHGWYDYKQGYSEELVKQIIYKSNPNKNGYILDPFCGVGTTNLTAQSMGYRSIGTDVNPMAVLATQLKTHYFTQEDIAIIESLINDFKLPSTPDKINGGKVIATSFTEDVLDTLLKIKFYVENLGDEYIQMFFRLALISIIDKCSLKVKDGNGLKFKKNYKPLPDLLGFYIQKCKLMLDDIKKANYKPECACVLGSMLVDETYNLIKNKPVNLCVFSPPYANCFDYCEVYKLELWIGGFVKSYSDFEKYRSIALRSHVNSKFDHKIKFSNDDVNTIASLISAFNIWNKNIPDMLRGYFDDMKLLLSNVFKMMNKGAKCYIVVANSAYKGILVPTDMLLADMAKNIGYTVNGIHVARKIRSSSQQMKGLYETYDNLMRESIVELKK